MNRFWRMGSWVAGATLGGVLVGLLESVYAEVAPLWPAAFYGTAWALGAAGLALPVALVSKRQRRRQPRSHLAHGTAFATALSVLVLVRFWIVRDILHEAPGAGWLASLAAVVAAVGVAAAILRVGRWCRQQLFVSPMVVGRLWLLPAVTLLTFGVLARGDGGSLTETGGVMGIDLAADADTETDAKAPTADDAALDAAATVAPGSAATRGVILIVADTLRADALGVYRQGTRATPPLTITSHPNSPTPHLDRFAGGGTVFWDATAQASWTKPAMASMLTSRHVSGHRTMSKRAMLPATLPTLAQALARAGVATGAVVTNYNLEAGFGFDRGFDTFRYLPAARYLGAPPRANRLVGYNVVRMLRERFFKDTRRPQYFYRSGKAVNAAAFRMLDNLSANQPFFLWLHYMEPHDPYFDRAGRSWARVSDPHPPPHWAEPMQVAYGHDVQRFDAHFGALMAGLQERGLADSTMVMVASDHGEEFAEHGGFYHGTTLYEEQLRIPLLAAGPGIERAAVQTDLARQIDLAPTVLARFGVAAPASWEGRDLLGTTPAPTWSLAEEDHQGHQLVAYRRLRSETGTGDDNESSSLNAGWDKLTLANSDNPRGLPPVAYYDLTADPKEQRPATNDHPGLETLRQALAQAQARAAQEQAQTQERELNEEDEEALRSLGYIQ